jgi:hypothetical protein
MDPVSWTTLSPIPIYLDESAYSTLAARPSTLDGKTLGLLPNWRPSATHVLKAVGILLEQRFRLKAVMMEEPLKEAPSGTKLLDSMREKLDNFAARFDAVIIGSGD